MLLPVVHKLGLAGSGDLRGRFSCFLGHRLVLNKLAGAHLRLEPRQVALARGTAFLHEYTRRRVSCWQVGKNAFESWLCQRALRRNYVVRNVNQRRDLTALAAKV